MSSEPAAIRTFGLSKRFGSVEALKNLDLEVRRGEVFGFLGPNGAGKTTAIRLLLDFIRPTSGRAEIFGLDTRRHSLDLRRRLGNLPGEFTIYPSLSGRAFMELCASSRGGHMPRAGELAERLDVDLSRNVGSLSTGNKQKVALIQAMMHDPELLILDEPTSGLDPLVRETFYELIAEEKARGKTVFFSSHVLPEAERTCDRVGIVRRGRLVAVEDVADLKRKKVRRMEVIFSAPVDASSIMEPPMDGIRVLSAGERSVTLAVPAGRAGLVIKRLADKPVADMVFPEATLEEAFMSLYREDSASASPEPGESG